MTLGNAARRSWRQLGQSRCDRLHTRYSNWAIQQVSEAGGASHPLTRLENGETGHGFPEFLPGNKAVLFATVGANPGIAAQSLGSGERRNLIPGGTSPRYVASGHLLYMQSGKLMAAPFDPQGLQITGPAVPVADGILPALRRKRREPIQHFRHGITGLHSGSSCARPREDLYGSAATEQNRRWPRLPAHITFREFLLTGDG